jgi:hypothetical protein
MLRCGARFGSRQVWSVRGSVSIPYLNRGDLRERVLTKPLVCDILTTSPQAYRG